jgi:predicted ArsR family transcriptional regulator
VKETYKIKDLEQIKLLSDPLKLQLLQAFAERAKTTKQVANELGESVTKLYRHVDSLHAAGLLVISAEKQKRGTVERTFRAVARRFEADQTLFAADSKGQGTNAARDMLRACEDELMAALATDAETRQSNALFMRLRCKVSPARVSQLRTALEQWIEAAENDADLEDENAVDIGALLAFYAVQ